jgi:6-pyruvoyl tetrahydropterin synthase/QueD family protein
MSTVIIHKSFRWEMAHFIHNDNSKCMNIHGHSFRLDVAVKQTPHQHDTIMSGDSDDMVYHTGELKSLVQPFIDSLDHCLLMKECAETRQLADFLREKFNIRRVAFLPTGRNPTMENMIDDFGMVIANVLPPGIVLHRLELRETESVWIEKMY